MRRFVQRSKEERNCAVGLPSATLPKGLSRLLTFPIADSEISLLPLVCPLHPSYHLMSREPMEGH